MPDSFSDERDEWMENLKRTQEYCFQCFVGGSFFFGRSILKRAFFGFDNDIRESVPEIVVGFFAREMEFEFLDMLGYFIFDFIEFFYVLFFFRLSWSIVICSLSSVGLFMSTNLAAFQILVEKFL